MVMRAKNLVPTVHVRNTGPAVPRTSKAPRIPTLYGHGASRYSDEVVAGVKYDLKFKPLLQVAAEWNIAPTTVGPWMRGINRAHVEPREWPSDKSKRQA